MASLRPHRLLLVLSVLAGCKGASAEDDLDSTYELRTDGSTRSVKAGGEGRFVLRIETKGDAHVSDESPLKVALAGKDVIWPKTSLGRADLKASPEKTRYPTPVFEVPFKAGNGREGIAEANVTFFICTKDICARRQKTVSVPISIQAAETPRPSDAEKKP